MFLSTLFALLLNSDLVPSISLYFRLQGRKGNSDLVLGHSNEERLQKQRAESILEPLSLPPLSSDRRWRHGRLIVVADSVVIVASIAGAAFRLASRLIPKPAIFVGRCAWRTTRRPPGPEIPAKLPLAPPPNQAPTTSTTLTLIPTRRI